jgi:predicted O-methyltransferase YrrM
MSKQTKSTKIPLKNVDQKLIELFEISRTNQRSFRSGAIPYKHYNLLALLVSNLRPKKILELGTGIGLTAIAMSLACPDSWIDSIDLGERNQKIAMTNAHNFGVNINFICASFKDGLQGLENDYDLTFFDGFEANLSEFTMLENHLKIGGMMICANIWNNDEPNPCFLQIQKGELYKNFFYFDDTAIAIRIG